MATTQSTTDARDIVEPSGDDTEFVFFSGKGGVGKSTVSCATATWLADNDYNTLLVTTDPAPNLSDIFGQEIGHDVTAIDDIDNLSAIEIDPDQAAEDYRQETIEPMRELLDDEQISAVEEQLNSPCVEEIAAFDNFVDFMESPEYDMVVFDTAPTGHTIRLMELPSDWNAELEKGGSTCVGPAASMEDKRRTTSARSTRCKMAKRPLSPLSANQRTRRSTRSIVARRISASWALNPRC